MAGRPRSKNSDSKRRTVRKPRSVQKRASRESTPRSVRRPRDGGLRRELIDAALALVQVSGTRGLSLREVARRAGVSHSAPYRHFENKEALVAAVAEQGFRTLQQRVMDGLASAPADSVRRFEAVGVAYVEFAARHPAHFRVMFGPDVPDASEHPSLRATLDATDSLFRAAAVQALERLGPRARGVDPAHFTLLAWSLVHGLASLIVDGRVGEIEKSTDDPEEIVYLVTGAIQQIARGIQRS